MSKDQMSGSQGQRSRSDHISLATVTSC